jgi:hypothetical protein
MDMHPQSRDQRTTSTRSTLFAKEGIDGRVAKRRNSASARPVQTEDFEQSFSEMFKAASRKINPNDGDADSDFYESVRESLGRLREQFDPLPSAVGGRLES